MISEFYINTVEIADRLQRELEFAIYVSSFRGMNGVKSFPKINKPSDVRKIDGDTVVKEKTLSGEAANEFMATIVKK